MRYLRVVPEQSSLTELLKNDGFNLQKKYSNPGN